MIATRSVSRARRGALVGSATAALALALVGGAVGVSAQDGESYPLEVVTDELGSYLTGEDGKTLYYFTRDVTPGVSACYGGCAEAWPVYAIEEDEEITAGDGVTGVISRAPRTDGTMQVTYDGRPLYYFADDEAAGDTKGQGVFNVWFVAAENGSMPANPPQVTLATASSADLGTFLTGADGKTLYYFTNDTVPGVSVCADDCATNWPPVTVNPGNTAVGGDGVTGVVGWAPRADGTLQVTYDGRPLYYFKDDAAAGDTNGQGRGDVWYVALVDGSVPEAPGS
jgi:predicted lipoprotein with Yx(FWY)xxD motif